MKSPICWYGGKHDLIKYLVPMIPEHQCYAELFGGGGWLLFAKQPSKIEIYNDIHEVLVTFFRIIKEKDIYPDQYQKFLHYCQWMPYSRIDYNECINWQNEQNFELKIAKWWFNIRMAFSSLDGPASWALGVKANNARKTKNHVSNFENIGDRLRHVQIKCSDWQILFDKLDDSTTFFYLDPPYLLSTRSTKGYTYEMTELDHINLIDRLKTTKAKVLLSGYPSELYNTLSIKYNWNAKKN